MTSTETGRLHRPDRCAGISRNEGDVTAAYPELAELTTVTGGRRLVLDGEVVAVDEQNRPSFSRLQQRMHVIAPTRAMITTVPVLYHVFEIDGKPVLHQPYEQRRELLAQLGLAGEAVRVPPHFTDRRDGQRLSPPCRRTAARA